MKTLYISDLDGTLLRGDERTSAYTNEVVNRLVENGLLFAYATARSYKTAKTVTAGIDCDMPAIVYNGTFIVDGKTGKPMYSAYYSQEEKREIYSAFERVGLCPVVYNILDGRDRFSYLKNRCSAAQLEFVLSRKKAGEGKNRREREVFEEERLLDGEVFYFVCIDEEARLKPVYDLCKEKYRCFFARDIYSGEMWLEILPKEASKATAALKLKQMLGCDRIVCFGDAVNDIPLFEISDECYAVQNAAEELKAIATGVIASNEDDGVARFLAEHTLLKELQSKK